MFYNRYNPKNCQKNSERITHKTRCRYCGEDVFYHKNEYDGRVFFQDLGGPWPKHFCKAFWNTDRAEVYIYGTGSMNIYWVKRGYDCWYRLNDVSADIVSSRYKGVYIVWYFDVLGIARTVKVGEGHIGAGLEAARRNIEVQRYAGRGLYATWALVSDCHKKSVSVSLSQKLQPFVGELYSGCNPGVRVGLPSKIRWHN